MSTAHIVTGQVTVVDTSESLIVPARLGRKRLMLFSVSAFYIGPSGVTAATGFQVPNNANAQPTLSLDTEAAVHAVKASSGSTTVSFIEQF